MSTWRRVARILGQSRIRLPATLDGVDERWSGRWILIEGTLWRATACRLGAVDAPDRLAVEQTEELLLAPRNVVDEPSVERLLRRPGLRLGHRELGDDWRHAVGATFIRSGEDRCDLTTSGVVRVEVDGDTDRLP